MSSKKVLEKRSNGYAVINQITPNNRLFVALVEQQEDGSFLRTIHTPMTAIWLSFADLEAVKEYYSIQ